MIREITKAYYNIKNERFMKFQENPKRKFDCITRIKGKENQKVSKDLKFR
jgi:hypothetical protein